MNWIKKWLAEVWLNRHGLCIKCGEPQGFWSAYCRTHNNELFDAEKKKRLAAVATPRGGE